MSLVAHAQGNVVAKVFGETSKTCFSFCRVSPCVVSLSARLVPSPSGTRASAAPRRQAWAP